MNNIISDVEKALKKIKIPYDHFIKCTINEGKVYQEENPNIWVQLLAYLTRHDTPTASDVCEYMGYLIGLPYYDDNDGNWYRWDNQITEEEAKRIVDEKYS